MYNFFLWSLFYCSLLLSNSQVEVSFSKTHVQSKKMPLLIIIHHQNHFLDEVAYHLSLMLACNQFKKTGFDVVVKRLQQKPDYQFFKDTFNRGISLMLILEKEQTGFSWYLYDTAIKKVLCAKQVTFDQLPTRYVAEHVADQLWPLLTGQEGFFTTRIACIRDKCQGLKDLCLIPLYAQPTSHTFNDMITVLIKNKPILAPRWNGQNQIPMVFFSEATDINITLKSISLDKKIRVISNFKGANLLPHFSAHGDKVVYCLSCEGKTDIYLYCTHTTGPTLKRISHNIGNNISPQLCANGDVIYCSDFKQKTPHICYWHADTDTLDVLTSDGFNTCPSFCEKTKKLAYCKFINGVSQIFMYDFTREKHEQITFDTLKKQECSWSPCGNYLIFASENGNQSQLMILNCITKEICNLTPNTHRYKYPNWSPNFSMPLITS